MATIDDVRRLALSLPETAEAPHFAKTSFRVSARIFATWADGQPLMLKLEPEDQANLVADDPARIAPVPGVWGRRGCTFIQLESLEPERLETLVRLAWAATAPKRLHKSLGRA
ncbi:MmcQ/YjbR family DNA-binding protein [Phenylobacterium deserti]|uniref:MmcQ/YjbR family DNA-binding protein n=1 Tax=Phenylobacterium deserti TaxID=1914756 RepID=A0A328AHW2_9CAUL|nr:MmcQ/YjbR family DNA-binding protein [Phenylobacterium deserti]RAK52964.1 MmcQ/YjbR family DNA-binding protein [Phenylobacterium deserti]